MLQELFGNFFGYIFSIGTVAVLCWFSYIYGRNKGIRNDGVSVQQIKEQLDRAESNQQSITDGITTVERGTESIQQQTSDIAESTERVEQSLRDVESKNNRATELVDECEQILSGIGERTKHKD